MKIQYTLKYKKKSAKQNPKQLISIILQAFNMFYIRKQYDIPEQYRPDITCSTRMYIRTKFPGYLYRH